MTRHDGSGDSATDLQEEIIRLGLDRAAELEAERERKLAASAATHAIEEAYELPESEARAIAEEAELEVANRSRARREQRVGLVATIIIGVGAIAGGVALFYSGETPEFEHGLTTAMSKSHAPVDALERLELVEGARVCVWARWQKLSEGHHEYRTEIRDGSGALVYERPNPFDTPGGTKMTWACYRPKVGLDAPGTWRFTVWFDGQEAFSATLPVEAPGPSDQPL